MRMCAVNGGSDRNNDKLRPSIALRCFEMIRRTAERPSVLHCDGALTEMSPSLIRRANCTKSGLPMSLRFGSLSRRNATASV